MENTVIQERPLTEPSHAHGDKYQSNFIAKYIFSMDHKMIAKQYLITGIVWAIIGAAMSVIFRLQLGFPEEDYAWLKPLLGVALQKDKIFHFTFHSELIVKA